MNEIKIAHTADLHIGIDCKGLGKTGEIRKNEIKNSIHKILEICEKEKVNFLLIAGDLFEGVNVSQITVDEIKNAFSKVSFKIIISPGNHDPFSENEIYSNNWPENVFIFKTNKMNFFEFPEYKVRVYGAAFTSMYQQDPLLKDFEIDSNFINIGIIHGDVGTQSSFYNPLSRKSISESELDYLALGHTHMRTKIQKIKNTHYAYSGCTEGSGFDECGEKGIYLGNISKNYCDLKFIRTCKRINEVLEIDISDFENDLEISENILKNLEDKFGRNYRENLYKIILKGEISDENLINPKNIKFLLSEKLFFVKIKDITTIKIDIQKLAMKNDFKGIFIKNMIEKQKNAKTDEKLKSCELAFKIGIKSFSEEVKYSEN